MAARASASDSGGGKGEVERTDFKKASRARRVSGWGPGAIVRARLVRLRKVREPELKSKPPCSPRTRSEEPVNPSPAGAIELWTKQARKPSVHSRSTE